MRAPVMTPRQWSRWWPKLWRRSVKSAGDEVNRCRVSWYWYQITQCGRWRIPIACPTWHTLWHAAKCGFVLCWCWESRTHTAGWTKFLASSPGGSPTLTGFWMQMTPATFSIKRSGGLASEHGSGALVRQTHQNWMGVWTGGITLRPRAYLWVVGSWLMPRPTIALCSYNTKALVKSSILFGFGLVFLVTNNLVLKQMVV